MARKKITTFTYSSIALATDTAMREQRKAVVYWDSQWQDAIVEYYKHGEKLQGASSHHYDDREDAFNTARSFAEGKF